MALSRAEKLLAIGIDSQTASRLAESGWTTTKLRKATAAKLEELGVSEEVRQSLGRPAIPHDLLAKVLHNSKRTCCVCRNPDLPIIVHHLEEWHVSRDHSEHNLAVLCLNDHGKAHTTGTLSQNLTAKMILEHKSRWEERVRLSDAMAIVGLSRVDGAN